MKNDRLIKKLVDQGRLTCDPETGQVYLDGRARGVSKGEGYLAVNITHRSKQRRLMCHRIVWIICNGIPKHGMEVDHKCLPKSNNRISNLELVTGAVNTRRAYRNGHCKPHNVRCGAGKFKRVEG